MNPIKKAIFSFVLLLSVSGFAQEVSYTLQDRERLIRLEERLDAMGEKTDKLEVSLTKQIELTRASLQQQIGANGQKIDQLNNKFDTYFLWGFGILFTMMAGLMGFILHDRRSTLAPVKREQDRLIQVIRDYAKDHKELRDLLKQSNLW